MTQLNRHDASVRPKQSRRNIIRHRAQRAFLASLAAGLLTTGMTGCTIMGGLQSKMTRSECVDDFMVSHRNKVMASKAWLRNSHCHKSHRHMKDLRKGFIEGYMEVATGGSGCTPAVVSSDYWGWKHQSGDGQSAVNAWFEGFPLGVKAAEQDGIGYYNQIRIQTPTRPAPAAMTGSMAPTPAAAAPPVATTNALPPGIQLGAGETLVPGRVTFEDPNEPAMGFPEEVPANLPVPAKQASEKMADPASDALDDPFSQMTPTQRPSDNFSEATESFLSDLPEQETSPPVDLVPKEFQTPVSTNVAEPTQDEIDSVIEEIFGRPDRQAQSNEAVESPANNQSMQFLFD
ncbi:hypothetical protein [Rhodopirellula sp. P2]|uniref:hypothetical protein n=1 Tax=Rhodopirellula sp. P2 TaxID=2127060 RepID=UPI003FD1CC6C